MVIDSDDGSNCTSCNVNRPASSIGRSVTSCGFDECSAPAGLIDQQPALARIADEDMDISPAHRPADDRRDDRSGGRVGPREVWLGDQAPERGGVGEFVALSAEHGEHRAARLGVAQVVEQVPPAELDQRDLSAGGAHCLAADCEEVLLDRGVDNGHGNRRICLAIVSSCICCDPP